MNINAWPLQLFKWELAWFPSHLGLAFVLKLRQFSPDHFMFSNIQFRTSLGCSILPCPSRPLHWITYWYMHNNFFDDCLSINGYFIINIWHIVIQCDPYHPFPVKIMAVFAEAQCIPRSYHWKCLKWWYERDLKKACNFRVGVCMCTTSTKHAGDI